MGGIAWQIERYPLLESTSTLAAERVRAAFEADESVHGLVIVAERQSGGRGQHGRKWESPAGGLYFSAVVQEAAAEIREKLSLLAGVAVADTLQAIGAEGVMVRWPNDVLIGDRKVAGILCESIGQGERLAIIIGIGINVRTEVRTLPAELRERAASLHLHSAAPSTDELLMQVLSSLGRILGLQAAAQEAFDRLRTLDYLCDRALEFEHNQEIVAGYGAGIDGHGHLLIRGDWPAPPWSFASGTLRSVNGVPLR